MRTLRAYSRACGELGLSFAAGAGPQVEAAWVWRRRHSPNAPLSRAAWDASHTMRPTPFVGRQHEVAQVRDALSVARQGSGSVVLLSGDAGIGKTSLAQEITRAAAWLGTPAIWGPAIEAEGTPPYWSWRQALTALSRAVEGVHLPDFTQHESGSSHFVFFEAVVAVLHQAAEPNGLLVVLDDLHWADSGSLRLLQVAAAQVPSSRVLILGAYRQPTPSDSSPLAQMLPDLLRERAVSRIVLGGLDFGEAESLLSQMFDRSVGRSVVRRLLEQTDGNPFYLAELAEFLRAGGPPQLPHTLGDIARHRLALISKSCRRILGPAAVIGRDFELQLLAAAVGAQPAAVLVQIAEAASAGVVEEIRPGQHRFTHALLREALYLDLSPAERAAAHARVAASIVGLGPGARAAHIDALAHHLHRALPLSDAAAALTAAVEAAESAEAQLAFEQAADRYAEAIEVASRATVPGHSRSSLLLGLARCQHRAGAAAAWQTCELAAASARDEHDVRALAGAALVMGRLVDPAIAHSLRKLCQEALDALDGADRVLEARLLGQMAIASGSPGDEPGLADRALEAARNTGDPVARFLALQAKEMELTGQPERAHERLELSEEAVWIAQETKDPGIAVWARSWRLGASWEFGLRGPADSELNALAEAVERTKEPLDRWRLEAARATLALIDGRYGDALEAAERTFEIGRRGGHHEAALFARVIHHLAAARTGDTTDEGELQHSLSQGTHRLWYASYLADQGRISELRDLWPAVAAAAVEPLPSNLWLIGKLRKAKLATALDDREWAAQLYGEIRPFSDLHATRAFFGGYEGPLALYAGQLAALLGRREQAEHLLRRALNAAAAIGSPPFVALARHQLACLLSRGRPRDRVLAVSLLEQAGATAEHLGMRPLARAVASELKALQHPRGGASLLSHREEEVAGLVAQGLTNRAIGERLHISERTAENHVKNILDKLGFDSRAQIAAWSVARDKGQAVTS